MLRLLSPFLLLAVLPAQGAPPPGFENPDHEIAIGVLPARLRYDTERFAVRPGSKVRLTLVNNDAMQHNLLILRRGDGVKQRVAALALKLGADAMAKDFVPDTPDVLFHTRAILPDERDTIWFVAPEEPGEYPYVCTLPGHVYTMVGVMQVGDAAGASGSALTDLTYRVYEGRWQELPDFTALEPVAEGRLADGVLDLAPLERGQHYGVRFDGTLRVKDPGRYTFGLNSDDGSRLFVDGKVVTEWDGVHPGGDERTGEIDLGAGDHALRVDFFQGGGGQLLRVSYRGPGVERTELTRGAAPAEPAGIPIAVHHGPRVMRVHVEGASARSIAVGLPGGTNYCFDAARSAVQFGWHGAFLDVGPDRQGRGGLPCKTLGPRFPVGDVGFPLRDADGRELAVRYKGYRLGAAPSFLLDWGGHDVTWTITAPADGRGLAYTFAIDGMDRAVRFVHDPKAARCVGPDGRVADGPVTIPADRSARFTVTVTPRPEGHE